MMGAAFFALPELELEKREAKALAEAIAEVSKHYNIPGIDPKMAAVVSLIIVAGQIYVPRGFAIVNRKNGKTSDLAKTSTAGAPGAPPVAVNTDQAATNDWFNPGASPPIQ